MFTPVISVAPIYAIATVRTRDGASVSGVPVVLLFDGIEDGKVEIRISSQAKQLQPMTPHASAWWRVLIPEFRQAFRVTEIEDDRHLIGALTPVFSKELRFFGSEMPR